MNIPIVAGGAVVKDQKVKTKNPRLVVSEEEADSIQVSIENIQSVGIATQEATKTSNQDYRAYRRRRHVIGIQGY